MTTKISKKVCTKCNHPKHPTDDFYMASDDLIYADRRLPICKVCLNSLVDMSNVELVIEVLRKIDKPFNKDIYQACLGEKYKKSPFGEYMRRMAMKDNRDLTYLDSTFDGDLTKFRAKNEKELSRKLEVSDVISFKKSPEMIAKWGAEFSDDDMYQLEQFYISMKEANDITTPQHINSLKIICKVNLLQNKALNEGDYAGFQKLNTQYNKLVQDAGFRPIDKLGTNETVGIRSFSQIWEEIEKDGFVPKHEIETTQDIVDKTILHMENYTRRFLNMQTVSEPTGDTPEAEGHENG